MDQQPPARSFVDSASPSRVGRYTYRPSTDTWTWSDGAFVLHGFAPGEVVPTTALVMRHMHPDDVDSSYDARESALRAKEPFTFPHRIRTATGDERVLVAVGHLDESGDEPVILGHLVDVTGLRQDAVMSELDQHVNDFSGRRATIEQAKGVLMQLYAIDADTAWQLLSAYSQARNLKVRELAELLVDAAIRSTTPSRPTLDAVHDVLDRLVAEQDPPA